MKAIIDDPTGYIHEQIPIPWLDAIDKVTEMSTKIPVIPIESSSSDHNTLTTTTMSSSIISLLHECKAFSDLEIARSDEDAYKERCNRRAIAFLTLTHDMGLFVYFGTKAKSLKEYCILNPQWLINSISCIVRDIKLHRLSCD